MKRTKKFGRYIFRSFFNFPKWMGFGHIKSSTKDLYGTCKTVFDKPEMQQPETFAEALKRLNITEDQLQARAETVRRNFLLFAAVAVCVLMYSIYLLFFGHWLALLLASAVTSLSSVYALKQHFWLFQIRNRKLGCTWKEWRQGSINPQKIKK